MVGAVIHSGREVVGTWSADVGSGSVRLSHALRRLWGEGTPVTTSFLELAERAAQGERVAVAALDGCLRRGQPTPHLEVGLACANAERRVFAFHAAAPEPGLATYVGVV